MIQSYTQKTDKLNVIIILLWYCIHNYKLCSRVYNDNIIIIMFFAMYTSHPLFEGCCSFLINSHQVVVRSYIDGLNNNAYTEMLIPRDRCGRGIWQKISKNIWFRQVLSNYDVCMWLFTRGEESNAPPMQWSPKI